MDNEGRTHNIDLANDNAGRVLNEMLNRNNQRTQKYSIDSVFKILLSKRFFCISLSLSILLLMIIYNYLRENDFYLKDLENEEMNKYFIGLFFLVLVLIWNMFLFFYQIVFNFEYSKINFSDEVYCLFI